MSDIFEAGGLGPPKAKGIKMMKRTVKAGQVNADLYFSVLGMQQYEGSGSPAGRVDFAEFNTQQPMNIISGLSGKIYFLLRIIYRLTSNLTKVSPIPSFTLAPFPGRAALGYEVYRCSFDYNFVSDKTGAADLKIGNINGTIEPDDDDHEGDDDLTVALNDFNAKVGGGDGGPDYISINPSVIISTSSSGSSLQGGVNVEVVNVGGGTNDSVSAAQPGSAIGFGTFKIPIHSQIITTSTPSGPPDSFKNDMALRLFYSPDRDVAFTDDKKGAVLNWAKKIDQKYAGLSEAVRSGALLLHVDGFASKTGTSVINNDYAEKRLNPVKDLVAQRLAVPLPKVSPKPYGDTFAAWEWQFDTSGNAKKAPREEDRAVKVWFDADEAWKVMNAK